MLLIDGFCSPLDSAEWEIIVSALIRLWSVVLVLCGSCKKSMVVMVKVVMVNAGWMAI